MIEKYKRRHKKAPASPFSLSDDELDSAKIALSMNPEAFVAFQGETLVITQQEFALVCTDFVAVVSYMVEHVLRDSRIDTLQVHDVVLVGGSSKVPWLQEGLRTCFGGRMDVLVGGDIAGVRGAARQAGVLATIRWMKPSSEEFLLIDPLSLSLGIVRRVVSEEVKVETFPSERVLDGWR